MVTLSEFTAAAADPDLRARLVAAAQEAGIRNAEQWVDANRGDLTRAEVGEGTSTVASVYAYALGEFKRIVPPRPGENPGAVTDNHIRHAVEQVLYPPQPPAPPADPPVE